ncbi:MAG: DUF4410 domain-containing protein [Candidatus Sulfotelmatobacter sp.]
MAKQFALLLITLAFAASAFGTEAKVVLIVDPFTLANGVVWPYDLNQMQLQTITELKIKDAQEFEISTEKPKGWTGKVYLLDGEVLAWHAGNKAERMMVGYGTGRETAKIHYWLTDAATGRKVFEHTDTIRQAFWGNQYANSVGQLAQPFADKIAVRLKETRLTT